LTLTVVGRIYGELTVNMLDRQDSLPLTEGKKFRKREDLRPFGAIEAILWRRHSSPTSHDSSHDTK
jgi:hypothetical protein